MRTNISSWSIEPGYIDARGAPQTTAPATISALTQALVQHRADRTTLGTIVRRLHHAKAVCFVGERVMGWHLLGSNNATLASGNDGVIDLPDDLATGSYRLHVDEQFQGKRSWMSWLPLLLPINRAAFIQVKEPGYWRSNSTQSARRTIGVTATLPTLKIC